MIVCIVKLLGNADIPSAAIPHPDAVLAAPAKLNVDMFRYGSCTVLTMSERKYNIINNPYSLVISPFLDVH